MKTILYTSPFVPAEWIAAYGFRPQRFRPLAMKRREPAGIRMGTCPWARAVSDVLTGRPAVAGVVVAATCDQMRRMTSLAGEKRSTPVFCLNVPATWQSAAARCLYRDELSRLGKFLEELGGASPSRTRLMRVMRMYDAARLCQRRRRSLLSGIPVALVGGPLFQPQEDILRLIRSCGGCVAVDGTETGERGDPAPFDMSRAARDPLAELTRAYFLGIPDVFQRPDERLYRWIRRVVKDRGIRGIVCVRHVWCDLWQAEIGRIAEYARVPVLDLDLDADVRIDGGRNRTRVQAFLETLR
jgi:benzoyl-CoA reductase/2-hydroxyglutaryl-CoA dehydratase subunit BcrC/BadD/HgdB